MYEAVGASLADLLEWGVRLAEQDCVELLRSVAGTLAQLHGCCVMHRDFKPEHVCLARGVRPVRAGWGGEARR